MSDLRLPPSNCSVRVRAIDTKTKMCVASRGFIQPVIPGFEILNLTSITFLIEHTTLGQKVLFDCGTRKDFENFAPATKRRLNINIKGLYVEKDVHEIVQEAGIPLTELSAMIWSHWHWDHHGAAEQYPSHVKVVVGPGFKRDFMPGYPTDPNAFLLDADFEGREVHEIEFSNSFKIGGFQAYDYFGDGSFYLLDTPGHAVGHICGLARTTPTTFILLGGDICHFGGSFRPSTSVPLPEVLPEGHLDQHFPLSCPCSLFTDIHPAGKGSEESRTSPFFEVSRFPQSAYVDQEAATRSIRALQLFDAHSDVLVCIAHDPTLLKILPFINDEPETDLNEWRAKGYKQKAQWGWLNELPQGGQPGREMYVRGTRHNGELVEDFTKLTRTSR
ncbi:metallo-beta-lactamase superfamily protein [Stagonosporopsis vannaccii]|nr:metallo-beta-lactamase superfamily protein [Stagonosporopsis vannaccii]